MASEIVLPVSLLDTDLYKFTMQQAVLRYFADVRAVYRFTHRDKDVYFSRECFERFEASASHFDELTVSDAELHWMEKTCPYFTPEYLRYLSSYRFKPEQLHMKFNPVTEDGHLGRIEIEAVGPWAETILWEVPLMACLSEIYFKTVDTDWNYDGQEDEAYEKAKILLERGCVFSEFGTRRRRSYHIQDLVVRTLRRASNEIPSKGGFFGTSNVHLAFKHNVTPVGTIAHEWFMAVGALQGYEHANARALELWHGVYKNSLLLALTDTFSSKVFFKDFIAHPEQARLWQGLRQDSGDPFVFAPKAKEVYAQLGIDHRQKTIIYSDALTVDKVLQLQDQCDELGFKCSFGIGTSLTNDFHALSDKTRKSKALNMVIKLASVNDKFCVKISDELSKNTGDKDTVMYVKSVFQL